MIDLKVFSAGFGHRPIRSVCGYVGSFDPFHKAHAWIADSLIDRFDCVLLLIPAVHFEKGVKFPENAYFNQRLAMMEPFVRKNTKSMAAGISQEPLFIRLWETLSEHFPGAELITFGMGDGTYRKFLASREYFQKANRSWTNRDDRIYHQLCREIIVFNRSGVLPAGIELPRSLNNISSTQIRKTIGNYWKNGVPADEMGKRLEHLLFRGTTRFIREHGIYALA